MVVVFSYVQVFKVKCIYYPTLYFEGWYLYISLIFWQGYIVPVWRALKPAVLLWIAFFFFLSAAIGDSGYCSMKSSHTFLLFRPFIISVGLVYCSWDPQISLFNNFFIKNGSHDTIHIFKNYFVIVFSVFNFSSNKFNSNRPNILINYDIL